MEISKAMDGAGRLIELIKEDMHMVRKYQEIEWGEKIVTVKSSAPNSKALSLDEDDIKDVMELVAKKMRAKVSKAINRLEIASSIADGYLDSVETKTQEEIDLHDVKPDVTPIEEPKIVIADIEVPEKKKNQGLEYRKLRKEVGEENLGKYVDEMFKKAYSFDAVQTKLKCSPATLQELMYKYNIESSRKRHGPNGINKTTAAGLPDPIKWIQARPAEPKKEKPKSLSEINNLAREAGMTYGQYMLEEEKKKLKEERQEE